MGRTGLPGQPAPQGGVDDLTKRKALAVRFVLKAVHHVIIDGECGTHKGIVMPGVLSVKMCQRGERARLARLLDPA